MASIQGRGLLLAALACAAANVARGQNTADANAPWHFLVRPALSINSVRERCPDLRDPTYPPDVPRVGECERLGLKPIGVAGGHAWYSALFARRWLMKDSGTTPADTIRETEVVLFITDAAHHVGRDTSLTPVWDYHFDPEMLRSVTPEMVSVNGGTLVAIDECLDGTGGCSQEFFLLRGARWSVVQPAFLDSLNRRFPNAINHGFHVDVQTLRATAAVYSPNDANCCPSRTAEMRLRLRGNVLEIIELQVRRSTEQSR